MKASSIAAICGMVLAAIAPSVSAFAQQKSAAACRAEWRANKAANQAAGKTEKAFVAECRSRVAPTAKLPAAAPAPRASAPPRQMPAQRRTGAPIGVNEFSTESEAKAHCPGDTVVWVNTKSRIYHFSGHRGYGSTKAGAYMCEKDTAAAGVRAAKNEKHP
jgi:plastocyanin